MDIFGGVMSIGSSSDVAGVRSLPADDVIADGSMGIDFACGWRWSAEKAGRGIDSVVAMMED
jgi:hypothetical protein